MFERFFSCSTNRLFWCKFWGVSFGEFLSGRAGRADGRFTVDLVGGVFRSKVLNKLKMAGTELPHHQKGSLHDFDLDLFSSLRWRFSMDFWSKFCFSSISWEGQKALQKGADDGTAPTHQAPIALSY